VFVNLVKFIGLEKLSLRNPVELTSDIDITGGGG
jgi:hypothetical protein